MRKSASVNRLLELAGVSHLFPAPEDEENRTPGLGLPGVPIVPAGGPLVASQVKTLTPPGPTNRPTTINTMPHNI